MSRLVALGAASATLTALAARPWVPGYLAWIALVPLLLALQERPSARRGAALFGAASLGLSAAGFEAALLVLPWSFAALALLASAVAAAGGAVVGLAMRTLGTVHGLLAVPFAVAAVEHLLGHRRLASATLSGASLAHTQADTALLPLAAWSGVTAVGFAVGAMNVAVLLLLTRRWRLGGGLALAAAVLVALPVPGATRGGGGTPLLRIAVVQSAAHPADMLGARFDPAAAAEVMAGFAELTRRIATDADLVVWGETVLPTPVRDGAPDPVAAQALGAARTLLVGGRERAEGAWFNSVFLARDGQLATAYRKQALVPIIEADFAPGRPRPPIEIAGVPIGLGICFDSVVGSLARDRVRAGAAALVYLTDDTFAGRTVTPELHLRVSAFRAAETRRPVVFANESGPSAVFRPDGRVAVRTRQGEAAAFVAPVAPAGGTTPFVRLGDWLGVLSLVVAGLVLVRARIGPRARRRGHGR